MFGRNLLLIYADEINFFSLSTAGCEARRASCETHRNFVMKNRRGEKLGSLRVTHFITFQFITKLIYSARNCAILNDLMSQQRWFNFSRFLLWIFNDALTHFASFSTALKCASPSKHFPNFKKFKFQWISFPPRSSDMKLWKRELNFIRWPKNGNWILCIR